MQRFDMETCQAVNHFMIRIFLLAISILIFAGCTKSDTGIPELKGSYKGTFQRQLAGGGAISIVNFYFENGNWSGESDAVKYPALCYGKFSIEGNTIHFTNDCAWTAEFDWSLILSGNYTIRKLKDSLEISRIQPGAYTDRYVLLKQ